MQFGLVGLGYAAASLVSAAILFARHLQELKYPVDASGGMWAFGDLFLWAFIVVLFAIPSVFLVWVIAKFESAYKIYSRLLLALSLSAPVCLGVCILGGKYFSETVYSFCFSRLIGSPLILAGIGVSRFVARFDRAKRTLLYALLIEGLTLVVSVALFIHAVWGQPSSR